MAQEQVLKLGIDSTGAKSGARAFEAATDRIGAAARSATTGVERLNRAADGLKSAGRKLTTFVTLPIAAVGVAATKMASDAQEAANKFDVVMGSSARRVRAEFTKLHSTIPLTTHEMEGLSAGVQDLLVPMGIARAEAAGMSTEFVKLAGDLGSFNNVSPQEAMRAITSGLAGEAEALRRYGVDVRAARLETLAYEAGLVKVGEELTAAARGQAVMLAITRDSKDAIGDAARTADSAANQIKFLGRNLKELAVTIGNQLLPVVTPLVARVNEILKGAGGLSSSTVRLGIAIASVAAVIGPLVLVLGNLASVAAAAATAMTALGISAGVAVGVLTGGLGLIALLGGLSAMFLKNKLDARAAAGEVDKYRQSLSQLSKAAAEEKAADIRRRKAELETERGTLPATVRGQRGGQLTGSVVIANPRVAEINREVKGLNQELGIVTRRLTDIRTEVSATGDPITTNLVRPLTRAADEARRLARELRDMPLPTIGLTGGRLGAEGRERSRENQRRLNDFSARGGILEGITAGRRGDPNAGAKSEGLFGKLLRGKSENLSDNVSNVIQAGSAGGGQVAQMIQAAAAFGPLAALLPIINGALEVLGPVLQMLIEPLVEVGRIIGSIVAPVLEMFAEPLRLVGELFKVLMEPLKLSAHILMAYFAPGLKIVSKVLRVLTIGLSYVMEGLGWFVEALGTFIDKLIPDWVSKAGKGLAALGREMQESARSARKGSDGVEDLGNAAAKAAGQLLNYANVIHINALRFRTSGGSGGGGGGGGGTGGGGAPGGGVPGGGGGGGGGGGRHDPGTHITLNVSLDGRIISQSVLRNAERAGRSGAPSAWSVATV